MGPHARLPAPAPRLTRRTRATLAAAAAVVAPHRFAAPSDAARFLADVEARFARLPPGTAADLERALRVLGAPVLALGLVGRPRGFAALAPEQRVRLLARLARVPVPLLRAVHHGVRRFLLTVCYADPDERRAIGALPPLHTRAPALPWEGPLAAGAGVGVPDDPPHPLPVATPAAAPGIAPGIAPDDTSRDASGGAAGAPPAARQAGTASPVAHGPRDRAPHHPAPAEPVVVLGRVTRAGALVGTHRLTADACVVGTGAGGAVAAARLAERGLDVVLLEAGDWHDPASFTEHEAAMTERLYAEQGLRATSDLSVGILQGEGAGGSTLVNWMIMLRPHAAVLDEWTRRFGLGALAAALPDALARVEREVGAAAVPDDAHSANNRLLLDGARALGWRARGGMVNARGCVRAGTCGLGCRWGAKQDMARTFLPRALAAGARLVAGARVERIERLERASAAPAAAARAPRRPRRRVAAALHDAAGRPCGRLEVEAPLVLLAAGAIGTPLVLQRSGLGGGGAGRFLRLHPTTAVVGVHDEPVQAATGIPLSTVCDEFLSSGPNGYGFWLECPPLSPMLAAAALPGFGAAHRAAMLDYARLGVTIALVRDGADLDRSSGDVRPGPDGRPRIRYRLGPNDGRVLRTAIHAAARLQLAAGAREARTLHADPIVARTPRELDAILDRPVGPHDVALFSAHVNGTCRLGADPRTSGTDPEGRRHGAPGVYVVDGSLLPTGLGVNPQATIMALASVIAESI